MENKLKPLKSKLILFCFFVLAGTVFSQNLVRYPLSNNLTPVEGPAAGMQIPGLDMIKYMDPPIQVTPNFQSSYLQFTSNNDELVLTFNATNYADMSVQFTGGIGVFLAGASGNIKVYLKIGAGPDVLIDQANISASWFGSDTHDFAPSLTGADHQSLVQIRIVGTSSSFGIFSYFGIQNLRIVSDNTTMNIRRNVNGYPNIPYNSDASVTLDTDFGSRFTNDPNNDLTTADKIFRITNTGSRPLKIYSLNVSPSDQGFSIVSAPASTVAVGGSTTFSVRFSPQSQGLRIANIIMNSNAIPNNPFTFQVKGNGKSCNLEPIPILVQNFETSGSNLNASVIAGNPNITGGNSNSPNPNTVGGALFPSNTDLYAPGSSTRSLYVRGTATGEVILEFGPIDITNQQEVSINFDLAAFGLTNNNNSGVNNSDYIILSVYNPTTNSWSEELSLYGSNNSTRRKYGYGASGLVSGDYDGNGNIEPAKTFNNSNGTKYGSFKLKIPPTISQLRYRITAYTSRTWDWGWQNYNLWLIDNVHIDAGNAKVKTWTGTGWTGENTNRPTDREKAVFNGTYNFSGTEATDLTVCECEVKSGKNVTIPVNRALTVRNKITNLGNGDNFVVKSGGNLIQIEDDAVNSGSITAERYVADMDNVLGTQMDYVYWSAPVAGQGLQAFSPGTPANRIYRYNEPNDYFYGVNLAIEPNFVPGKGYAIRAEVSDEFPASSTGYNKTYKFVGVPNNGVIPVTVQRSPNTGVLVHGYNLIGNPYPSNISFPEIYAMNSGIIYNTAWFWTNNNYELYQEGQGYSGNNYAVYNGTGGVSATQSTAALGNGNSTIPNGIVSVGQSFIVQVKNLGLNQTVNFRNKNGANDVRVTTAATFFNRNTEQKDRFWLKLTSPTELVNTQLIGYIAGATHSYEQDYDAELMGMSSDAFYSILEDKQLQIQGKGAFHQDDLVRLGANIFSNGNYTIALENPEGIFATGQQIYLKDRLLNVEINLSEQDYTFNASKGITEGRFEIVYLPTTILGTQTAVKSGLVVYKDGGDFVLKNTDTMNKLDVYDMSGRMIHSAKPQAKEFRLNASTMNNGVYILQVQTPSGIHVKRVIK